MSQPRFQLEPQNLARHLHEALILAVLAGGPRHGYQLALEIEQRSEGFFSLNHGTLYPTLHKLEKSGYIQGAWSAEGPGRRRRQYLLTRKGRQYAAQQLGGWKLFAQRLFDILGEVAR